MNCADCKSLLRPYGVLTKDAPGTVARGSGNLCSVCYRARRNGAPAECGRCPVVTKLIKGLCEDCRDVLSKEEKKLWAA